MDALMQAVRRLTRLGLWFSGALVLAAAVLIGVDVCLRKFFAKSIGGADELAGYALAIGTAWSLAAALVDRAHIRIDSLYVLFPARLRVALDFLGLVLFVGFFGLVAWHGWNMLAQSWSAGSRSQSALQTPTVVPQAVWFAGMVIFVAVGIVLFVHALRLAARGKLGAVAAAIGTRSAEEEVEAEVQSLKERRSHG